MVIMREFSEGVRGKIEYIYRERGIRTVKEKRLRRGLYKFWV